MASIVVTEGELLEALAAAAPAGKHGPKDARTMNELREVTGMSRDALRRSLRALQQQGRLIVHTVYRPNITGQAQPVPAYTIAPAKKRK